MKIDDLSMKDFILQIIIDRDLISEMTKYMFKDLNNFDYVDRQRIKISIIILLNLCIAFFKQEYTNVFL
jgi:hypothetical protein